MSGISWAWAPVIGIGMCAIANAAMFTAARKTRPQPVEDLPWLRSAQLDDDKLAAQRFENSGLVLGVGAAPSGALRLSLSTPKPVRNAMVACYRPDDRGQDRLEAWGDPTTPLDLLLPRSGRWRLRLRAETDDGAVVREVAVEAP